MKRNVYEVIEMGMVELERKDKERWGGIA